MIAHLSPLIFAQVDQFEFDQLGRLRLLLLVLGCIVICAYGFAMKRRALAAFASSTMLASLIPALSFPRQYIKSILVLVAMICIVFALIGPRYGAYWEPVQSRQLDLMICLDVSRSMLAEDAGMSRLARAKDDIKRLVDKLGGGMIGLIAFAGKAELVCPLTDDYQFYRLAVDDVGLHSATVGGTNIAEAIRASVKGFGNMANRQRAIIILTDGEDQSGTATDEAAKAHENNKINVYALGIGDSTHGSVIPIKKDGRQDFVTYEGKAWESRMDPSKLKAIAAAGGGEYHPSAQVTATQRTLEWLYQQRLAPMEERNKLTKQIPKQYPRFAWPAAAALALLVIEGFIKESRPIERKPINA